MAQQASPEPNGQSEFFCAQVMKASALARRNGPLSKGSLIAPPEFEGPGLPGIDIADEEDSQEHEDLDESEKSQLVVNDRPGEEKERFDLENDKDEGQQVEADRRRFPGRRCRRIDAALIRLALVADKTAAVADEGDEAEEADRKEDRNDEEQEEVPIVLHEQLIPEDHLELDPIVARGSREVETPGSEVLPDETAGEELADLVVQSSSDESAAVVTCASRKHPRQSVGGSHRHDHDVAIGAGAEIKGQLGVERRQVAPVG